MKEKLKQFLWIIPTPVFIIAMAIANYWLGTVMSNINLLYSNVGDYKYREEFAKTLITLVLIWTLIRAMTSVINKITNIKIIDTNYMKWIRKLTYSKISSITNMGTGGINSTINNIVQCNKQIIMYVVQLLPYIVPFAMVCHKEYKTAGILPVIVNVSIILVFIILNVGVVVNMKTNKLAAKAVATISSVTVDCIHNSKTVKYFQKESWSIDRQSNGQKKLFIDRINFRKQIFCNVFVILGWASAIINSYLCWDDKGTVLFLLMSDYIIENIAGTISGIFELYSDKKASLKLIGELEPDRSKKITLESSGLNINGVFYNYPESDVTFRIDDIKIEKGKHYCITGKSGFGKSTFIKLITNTIEPCAASNHIDNIDCIYMFAESEMFNMSIYDNIALGDDSISVSEVKDILEHLEVDVDLNIENDSVGEKGDKLSTGQIQRINLARVIVYARRHPDALIALDEVTSALDEITSINCINYLASEFKRLGNTLLYVSNKSDYKNSDLITDNIYVIRNGNTVTYSHHQ